MISRVVLVAVSSVLLLAVTVYCQRINPETFLEREYVYPDISVLDPLKTLGKYSRAVIVEGLFDGNSSGCICGYKLAGGMYDYVVNYKNSDTLYVWESSQFDCYLINHWNRIVAVQDQDSKISVTVLSTPGVGSALGRVDTTDYLFEFDEKGNVLLIMKQLGFYNYKYVFSYDECGLYRRDEYFNSSLKRISLFKNYSCESFAIDNDTVASMHEYNPAMVLEHEMVWVGNAKDSVVEYNNYLTHGNGSFSTIYNFDSMNNIVSHRTRSGEMLNSYQYDAKGRLIREKEYGSWSVKIQSYEYDGDLLRHYRMEDDCGVVEWRYYYN